MKVLFVGIREKGENIIDAPKKISNYLYNNLKQYKGQIYFYGLPWEDTCEKDLKTVRKIDEYEYIGPLNHLGKFIKNNKIDVVYFARYYSLIAVYLILLKFLYRFKLVYTVHGVIKKEREINKSFKYYSTLVEKLLLKISDSLIVVSHGLKGELLKYYPSLRPEKIHIVNNGASLPENYEKVDIRKLYGLKDSLKIILTVGTRKIKNIEHLIQSFISNDELYNSSYLLICGETDSEYCKYLISSYGSYEHIKFIGKVDTNLINNLYRQCALYVQISKFETFGLSIVEAMLNKKNVIISSSLPITEYFQKEEAYLYNEKEQNLSDLLLHCANNSHLQNENGYNLVNTLFNWQKVSDEYYRVFEDTLTLK